MTFLGSKPSATEVPTPWCLEEPGLPCPASLPPGACDPASADVGPWGNLVLCFMSTLEIVSPPPPWLFFGKADENQLCENIKYINSNLHKNILVWKESIYARKGLISLGA